jgi:hypothetical protein
MKGGLATVRCGSQHFGQTTLIAPAGPEGIAVENGCLKQLGIELLTIFRCCYLPGDDYIPTHICIVGKLDHHALSLMMDSCRIFFAEASANKTSVVVCSKACRRGV